ncbi:unnamed protein product [Tilletia laevis]|uniref:Uncharacterized protein n=2 Tax=Tilletia TaxID=13289 RepID=A0A9N8M099_9BASI|nr:unnamed protein product [Tilletia caries]CAD6900025.1 unnamed protein product [Tilletia controversa]CAD6928345.1 unnamed protein product [Tilletia laevis]CAD6920542.1 unnamed protein product [Tilletia caries]CAD6952653.1 unnamed protein product [Tilletia laevis]
MVRHTTKRIVTTTALGITCLLLASSSYAVPLTGDGAEKNDAEMLALPVSVGGLTPSFVLDGPISLAQTDSNENATVSTNGAPLEDGASSTGGTALTNGTALPDGAASNDGTASTNGTALADGAPSTNGTASTNGTSSISGTTPAPSPLPAQKLTNNQTFIDLAIESIQASQRASWEQGVTVQALLEWKYPNWTTYEAPGPSSFHSGLFHGGAANVNRHERSDYPKEIVLQAMRSVVAQDSNGRLGAKVTGDEDAKAGSSLDSASSLESVLLAAYASGQIHGPWNTLDSNGVFSKAAKLQYNFIANKVPRGVGRIISQRMDRLQYWADTFYMGPPALAAFGLYTRNSDAQLEAYNQVKLYRDKLLYPKGSGSKTGLLGHIRNEDGSWADPAVWVTGQGWGALGMLRVAAALAQSSSGSWTSDLLTAAHDTFDSDASLWHNYVDDHSTFHDVSGSLALAAATYRLAALAPNLVDAYAITNAEAVYKRVIPHLSPFGQFGDGLQCVDALSFSTPGYTSVESLSFGILLEAARRDYSNAVGGKTTALVRTIGGLDM